MSQMSTAKNIFLVGPMGAGKSTIGRYLAKTLDRPYYDSDREIESRTGVDIATIFEIEGEPGFREREIQMIDTLTRKEGIVLATGGGCVTKEQNRECLSQRGRVVYLHASVDKQLHRTKRDRKRPLLSAADPEELLRELFSTRDPLYRSIAEITIDTDQLSIPAIITKITKSFRLASK